jgi:hypothetical protein
MQKVVHMPVLRVLRAPSRLAVVSLLVGLGVLATTAGRSHAANSTGCEGGGFSVLGLSGSQDVTLRPAQIPAAFLVRGRYVEFTVVSSTLGIENYTFTGAPNPLDMTGGRRTVVFASKTPDHRGLSLTGDMRIRLNGEKLVLQRTGPGLDMKIQASDCAAGGIFQMEPARADGLTTRITHVLADGIFYFDNPNFRAREGDVVPFQNTTLTITPRNNFANDLSPNFVGRDSAQVASRITQGCVNSIPAPRRPGGTATVDHCGGVSVWNVASGGRMGGVFGEDATEVSPAAMDCVKDCQAQDQIRGRAALLGFPFPVPAANRFQPRFPAGWIPQQPSGCTVPNASGRSLGSAQGAIRRASCSVGRIRYARSRWTRGRVLGQSPRQGLRLLVGSRVNLVVSRGRP